MSDIDLKRKRALARQKQLSMAQRQTFMGNVNRGIAETTGGLVDLFNPFDGDEFGFSTGSAVDGITNAMRAGGVRVEQDEPSDPLMAFARGSGNAAGALVPVTKLIQAARSVGGSIGAIADDAYNALASLRGTAAEITAGGLSGSAAQSAKEAGAPEWVQNTAAVAAPMAIPATAAAVGSASRLAGKTPAGRVARGVVAAVAPMSERGARQVARDRLHSLAGGEDRARELGNAISENDIIGRTPAQQTNDPNLLGLEEAVADANPVVRERIRAQTDASRAAGQNAIADLGPGEIADARRFFDQRLEQAAASRLQRVERVLQSAQPRGSTNAETRNSTEVVEQLRRELDDAAAEERQLWAALPKSVTVPTSDAKAVARQWEQELGKAGAGDMPALARRFLIDGGYNDLESAGEVHRLYSKLRETARNARAGTQTRPTLAKVADDIADAILRDMDTVATVSRPLSDARNMTRQNAELFDQGAVGRILRRTNQGDEQIAPETSLARTIGRGGAQAVADDISIRNAAPGSAENTSDFLRGEFANRLVDASGNFSRPAAARWMRDNQELLARYPNLRNEMRQAMSNAERAEVFAARSEIRAKTGGKDLVEFGRGQDSQAAASILGADNPAKAARGIAATARKDQTGRALSGVKRAFTDFLIGKANTAEGISGAKLKAVLSDRNTRVALRQFFDASELNRLTKVADALATLDTPAMSVGGVIDTPANRIIDLVVRTQAARLGGSGGGGSMGGSLQTANIAVNNAQRALNNLTNSRARQMLVDAVQDPALMRALLHEPKAAELPDRVRSRLAPYLTGAAASERTEQQSNAR